MRAGGLLDLADQVVCERPPADQAHVVTAALAGDPEDVAVVRLAEALVHPDDAPVLAVEVAEPPPAGLSGPVRPRALAAPAERVAFARIAAELLPLPLRLVRGVHRWAARIDRDLPAVGTEAGRAGGRQAHGRGNRPDVRNSLLDAAPAERGRDQCHYVRGGSNLDA